VFVCSLRFVSLFVVGCRCCRSFVAVTGLRYLRCCYLPGFAFTFVWFWFSSLFIRFVVVYLLLLFGPFVRSARCYRFALVRCSRLYVAVVFVAVYRLLPRCSCSGVRVVPSLLPLPCRCLLPFSFAVVRYLDGLPCVRVWIVRWCVYCCSLRLRSSAFPLLIVGTRWFVLTFTPLRSDFVAVADFVCCCVAVDRSRVLHLRSAAPAVHTLPLSSFAARLDWLYVAFALLRGLCCFVLDCRCCALFCSVRFAFVLCLGFTRCSCRCCCRFLLRVRCVVYARCLLVLLRVPLSLRVVVLPLLSLIWTTLWVGWVRRCRYVLPCCHLRLLFARFGCRFRGVHRSRCSFDAEPLVIVLVCCCYAFGACSTFVVVRYRCSLFLRVGYVYCWFWVCFLLPSPFCVCSTFGLLPLFFCSRFVGSVHRTCCGSRGCDSFAGRRYYVLRVLRVAQRSFRVSSLRFRSRGLFVTVPVLHGRSCLRCSAACVTFVSAFVRC